MIRILTETFGDKIAIQGSETGLHLIVEFSEIEFTDNIVEQYQKSGLQIYPVWHHSDKKSFQKNSLIMGYSHLDEVSIKAAILMLSSAM